MSRGSRVSSKTLSKSKYQPELTNLPFLEWVDHDINHEKWDIRPKESKKSTPIKPTGITRLSTISEIHVEPDVFHDSQTFHLPTSINADDWKRPSELYQNVEFVISKPYIDFTSLREGSIHIMHSQFVRNFLNSISILNYVSAVRPWEIESVNHNYTPNTENMQWKPWHHIYAFCGAGKGQSHAPKYNPTGKYIIRLHWLGCWRKIYVDDKLPVDKDNNILLPGFKYLKDIVDKAGLCTAKHVEAFDKPSIPSKSADPKTPRSKKSSKPEKAKTPEPVKLPQIELWPYILSKALMKVACLTWTKENEIVDFNPISCLTGWICQNIDTRELPANDIWHICMSYSPNFEWEEDEDAKNKNPKVSKKVKSNKGSSSKESKKDKKEKKNDKVQTPFNESKVYCLVGSCNNIKNFIKDLDIQDIQAEWNQEFLIEESRDKPLIKPEDRPELPKWKRFRWLKWAISKGLWPADELSDPIRCLKLYNNFKPTDPLALKDIGKDDVGKKGKKEKGSSNTNKKDISKVSSKVNANGVMKIQFPIIDQSVWVDFSDIEVHINTLHIFFRPSQFVTNIQLSNCRMDQAKDKLKKPEDKLHHELKWSLNLKDSRNEPFYLLVDSLDKNLLVLNLCQSGYVGRIVSPLMPTEEIPYAYVILEEYNWQNNVIGTIHLFLRTIGSRAMLLYLPAGRAIYKLWLWCNNDYCLNILCNISVTVGTVDYIFDAMHSESLLLSKLAQEVGTAFGNLVQSFGTTFYIEQMRKFYKVYIPGLRTNKTTLRKLYNEFISILLEQIATKHEEDALKVLFLDPSISCSTKKLKSMIYNYETLDQEIMSKTFEDEIETKIKEKAAVKIQSIMKGTYIRNLLERRKQTNKRYCETYDTLKDIYYNIFSDTKRALCMTILKQLYLKCDELHHTLMHDEILKAIDIKVQKGTVTPTTSANLTGNWVFITRQKFINRSSESLVMRIALIANLSKHIVRVFNNDDLQEIRRVTNNTEGHFYPPNQKGFTIMCYGWINDMSKINWKLLMVYLKTSSSGFIINEDSLDIKSITCCYRPDIYANICKCKVEITRTADVTLRLSTSGKNTEIKLLVRDSWGTELINLQGKQNVILPLIRLKCLDSTEEVDFPVTEHRRATRATLKNTSRSRLTKVIPSNPTIYYVEAYVLNNTWPLTKKQWLNVKAERNRFLLKPPLPQDSNIIKGIGDKRTASLAIDNLGIEDPYWTLQVIHDIGESLRIDRDLTRQEEINQIKRSWYSDDPERYNKSQQFRENYLNELGRQDSSIMMNSESDFYSDTVLERWIPETSMAELFDLSQYYFVQDYAPVYLADPDEWETFLMNRSRHEICTLHHTISECHEKMERAENDQIENFVIIRQWYQRCREDSAELIKSSYALRDTFIDMLLEHHGKP